MGNRRNCSKINLMGDDKKLEEKLISFDNWVTELVDLVPASVYIPTDYAEKAKNGSISKSEKRRLRLNPDTALTTSMKILQCMAADAPTEESAPRSTENDALRPSDLKEKFDDKLAQIRANEKLKGNERRLKNRNSKLRSRKSQQLSNEQARVREKNQSRTEKSSSTSLISSKILLKQKKKRERTKRACKCVSRKPKLMRLVWNSSKKLILKRQKRLKKRSNGRML